MARGLLAFFDRRLDGLGANGRACSDCHMVTDNFQLSPASAEARFRLLQWRLRFNDSADDPLFRPVDADDFRINGEDAHDYVEFFKRVQANAPPGVVPPIATTDGVHFDRAPAPEERAASGLSAQALTIRPNRGDVCSRTLCWYFHCCW